MRYTNFIADNAVDTLVWYILHQFKAIAKVNFVSFQHVKNRFCLIKPFDNSVTIEPFLPDKPCVSRCATANAIKVAIHSTLDATA